MFSDWTKLCRELIKNIVHITMIRSAQLFLFPAFLFYGPWFESHLRPEALHVDWVFQSLLDCMGFPYSGVFLPRLETEISSVFPLHKLV